MGVRSRLDRGHEKVRSDARDSGLDHGAALLAQGKAQAAERVLRDVLQDFPDSAVAHALFSMALADQDRGREAMGAAADAIGIDPHLALAHAARACALETIGLSWEAEMEGRQAVALAPTDPNRHSDLAGIVGRAGRHSEALEITARGLSLNPGHLPSLHCRARALVSLGRVDEAQELMASALLDDPDLAQLRAGIGRLLEQEGHAARAADEYREALRLDKSVVIARHGLRRVDPPYRRLLPTNWRRKRG